MTLDALREYGIEWGHAPPKESCPSFPGKPIYADWGVPDPTVVEDETGRRLAFKHAVQFMARRIDLMLAVPIEQLARGAQEQQLREIGRADDGGGARHSLTRQIGAPSCSMR